jgi:GNAT superfamily N-acetyltransferase
MSVSSPQPAFRFDVLRMGEADLPAAHELSRAVAWPHRLEDWQFVLSVGEGLVAYSGDRLVGTAMWWSFDARLVRLGMVIVDPTIQRSGVGRALMEGILGRITEPTTILNATKAGETLSTASSGFRASARSSSIRAPRSRYRWCRSGPANASVRWDATMPPGSSNSMRKPRACAAKA